MLGKITGVCGVLLAAAALGTVGGGLLALPGCTSVIYDSNPEGVPLPDDEKPDFASRTVRNLMAESISWASGLYPPPADAEDGWFAINLPAGVTREQYIDVAARVGDRAAPITPELDYLPAYHIGWVWMRGDHARVDVFRPVFALQRGGEPVYQAVTLHLKRRFSSWRVEQTQPWEPGVVPLPPVYYLPPPVEDETGELEPDPVEAPSPEASENTSG